MIGIDEAWRLVKEHAQVCGSCRIPIGLATGFVLDEPIHSTIDSPSHDKSQVDGFAIRTLDVPQAGCSLRLVEEITAGQVPTIPLTAGLAARIMTGAPIPDGADAVVMVERTETSGETSLNHLSVRIQEAPRPGQNIMRRAAAMQCGDEVLRRGHLLRSVEIGLLAELGVTEVAVVRKPTVAIISTGNELVACDQTPGPGQIRNSNGPMLESLVREAGGDVKALGIARDTMPDLTDAVRLGLEYDVLLLSGGVSAGILDLVPQVLREAGVQEIFHKVQLKPGKPLWFGVKQTNIAKKLVFGLPGNPVSSLVCFELFVRPCLSIMAGKSNWGAATETAELVSPFRHRGERATFFPGRSRREEEKSMLLVEPLDWRGSADLRTLADADALICFEAGNYELPAGSIVRIRRP